MLALYGYGEPNDAQRPYRRLAVAIMEVAIMDMLSPNTLCNGMWGKYRDAWRDKIKREVSDWFADDCCTIDDFGSFRWCCDILGLSPSAVRQALSDGKARKFRRLPDSYGLSKEFSV